MSMTTLATLSENAIAIAKIVARRPIWVEQLAARNLAHAAAKTAPLWRYARVAGPLSEVAVRGTSIGATVTGVGGLALTAGVPIVVCAGVWVMLGSGYYQARMIAKKRGLMTGFSQGFVTGVLKWEWHHTQDRFAKRFVVNPNAFDPGASKEEAIGFNEGLIGGWASGKAASEEMKKSFRISLRAAAKRSGAREWSKNDDDARNEQIGYVIQLAVAGLRSGLIVTE